MTRGKCTGERRSVLILARFCCCNFTVKVMLILIILSSFLDYLKGLTLCDCIGNISHVLLISSATGKSTFSWSVLFYRNIQDLAMFYLHCLVDNKNNVISINVAKFVILWVNSTNRWLVIFSDCHFWCLFCCVIDHDHKPKVIHTYPHG